MASSEEKIVGIIAGIYDAALAEENWPSAMHGLGMYFGSHGVTLHGFHNGHRLQHVSDALLDHVAEYQNFWWQHDPLVAFALENPLVPGFFSDRLAIGEEAKARSPFYQEWLSRQGVGDVFGLHLNPMPGMTLSVSFQSPAGGEIGGDRVKVLGLLCEHIARARILGNHVQNLTAERDVLLANHDRFVCGAALLRADGTVLAANDRLRDLDRQGLSLRRNRLVVETPGQQREFDRFIGAAASGGIAPGQALLSIQREVSLLPLLLRAIPVSAGQAERYVLGAPRVSSVLLLVVDAEASAETDDYLILRSLGLTKAQSHIAYLIGSGYTPAEVATMLSISLNTVRTVVKAVYLRLGISRQAELAKLVSMVRPLA